MDPVGAYVNNFTDWGNELLNMGLSAAQGGEKIFETHKKTTKEFEHLGFQKLSTVIGDFDVVKIKTAEAESNSYTIDFLAKGVGLVRQEAYLISEKGDKSDKMVFSMELISTSPKSAEDMLNPKKLFGFIPQKGNDYIAQYEKLKQYIK